MELKTKTFTGAEFKAEGDDKPEGYIRAKFSTFEVVDRDKEVLVAGSIPSKEVPLVVAHRWDRLPVGKGLITSDNESATFEGQFFLETDHGKQAYLTAKAMGSIQQYSWAFNVLESEKGERNKQAVNLITKTEPFEVTLALVGVNRETETLEIKGIEPSVTDSPASSKKMYLDVPPPEGSYEELKAGLCDAFRKQQFGDDPYGGYAYIIATYDNKFVACMWSWDDYDEAESYWEVSYSKSDSGEYLLGAPKQVQASIEFIPKGVGVSFEEHSDYVQVAVAELVKRGKAGSAVRAKAGRAISQARRERLEGVVKWLQDGATELQGLLDETAVSESEASDDDEAKAVARKEFAKYLKSLVEAGV